MDRLAAERERGLLAALPDWPFDEARGAIRRRFVFADFAQALAFMTVVARAADKRDHRPERSNVDSRVDILRSTHDAGGLTEKDIELARCADSACVRFADA